MGTGNGIASANSLISGVIYEAWTVDPFHFFNFTKMLSNFSFFWAYFSKNWFLIM
jgi:hypothetical protein